VIAATLTLTNLLHPYSGMGYQFWSGIGSDLGEATLVTMAAGTLAAVYHHHRCTCCRRLGKHTVQVHAEAAAFPLDGRTDRMVTTPAVSHIYRTCRHHLDADHHTAARH
jgi:hypothetical protein